MNKLAFIAVSFLLFFGAMLWYLAATDWNGFIASQVTMQGSQSTEQTVTLRQVDSQLENGVINFSGFTLSNPAGYSTKNALLIDNIAVRINQQSIATASIIIESVHLNSLSAAIEFNNEGVSNFQQLSRQISNQIIKVASFKTEKFSAKKSRKKTPQTRIKIEQLVVNNIIIKIDSSHENTPPNDIKIPQLTLALNQSEQGILSTELGSVIAEKLIGTVNELAKQQNE